MKARITLFLIVSVLVLTTGLLINALKPKLNGQGPEVDGIKAAETNELALPESNLEWLDKLINVKKGLLKRMEIATTLKGSVYEIKEQEGVIDGLEHYYVGGEKGKYIYGGLIGIESGSGVKNTYYLSKRRMGLLKVYEYSSQGIVEKKFGEIKAGDNIELEEAVDLAVSNIDDQNVLYITIRILK